MNQDVAWRTETERKQSGGYVHAVWSGAGPGPSQLGWNRWSGEAERSIAPSGTTGSSGRWSRWSLGPLWLMRAGWPWLGRSLPYVRQGREVTPGQLSRA